MVKTEIRLITFFAAKLEKLCTEVSKDLEPSVIHGTFYYDLLCEQIKKFKGQITLDEAAE